MRKGGLGDKLEKGGLGEQCLKEGFGGRGGCLGERGRNGLRKKRKMGLEGERVGGVNTK